MLYPIQHSTNTHSHIDTSIFYSSPEYALLLHSMVHLNETSGTEKYINNAIDWLYLIDIADHHGLLPMLNHALNDVRKSVTESTLSLLNDRYQANLLRNRILTDELATLLELFNKHDIPALAYKGPSLALDAYSDLAMRQFGDLDILIQPNHVHKASELLISRQYHRSIAKLTPTQENDFIRTAHEHNFISPDQLIHIDLHWSLSNQRFPFQLSQNELFTRSQSLTWQGRTIEHIGAQDLLLILCMHANKDLWRKLVWVCDIDQLIRKHADIDWQLLVKQAELYRCKKMLYMALCICHDLLNTPVPEDLLISARTKTLVKKGNKALAISINDARPINTYLQCMAIQPHILSVCDTWYIRLRYITLSLITPTECDMHRHQIPHILHFIYYIITPIRKLLFCSTRAIKRFIFN